MEEKIVMLLEKIVGELSNLNAAMANEDRTMEPKEAAEYLGLSYDTLLRWAREGIVPSAQPGGHRVLFRKKALDKWLAQHESQNTKKAEPEEKQYGKLRKIQA